MCRRPDQEGNPLVWYCQTAPVPLSFGVDALQSVAVASPLASA